MHSRYTFLFERLLRSTADRHVLLFRLESSDRYRSLAPMTAKVTDSRFDILYKKYGRVIYARCRRMLWRSGDRGGRHTGDSSSVSRPTWTRPLVMKRCSGSTGSRPTTASTSCAACAAPGSSVADVDPSNEQGEEWLVNRDLAHKVLERRPEHLRAPVWLYTLTA